MNLRDPLQSKSHVNSDTILMYIFHMISRGMCIQLLSIHFAQKVKFAFTHK